MFPYWQLALDEQTRSRCQTRSQEELTDHHSPSPHGCLGIFYHHHHNNNNNNKTRRGSWPRCEPHFARPRRPASRFSKCPCTTQVPSTSPCQLRGWGRSPHSVVPNITNLHVLYMLQGPNPASLQKAWTQHR